VDSSLNVEAQLCAATQLNCNKRRIRWLCASATTWKLARMNLAIRGIDANLGPRNADSFRADLHPDLKADFSPVRKDLANPSFNVKAMDPSMRVSTRRHSAASQLTLN
jgi:type I restriction-modification system DNA methylase subunit